MVVGDLFVHAIYLYEMIPTGDFFVLGLLCMYLSSCVAALFMAVYLVAYTLKCTCIHEFCAHACQ